MSNPNNQYTEAFDTVLDWMESTDSAVSKTEYAIAEEAYAQIVAYTGRAYDDIRQDIANTAVAALTEIRREQVALSNVTSIVRSRSEVIADTQYVITATKLNGAGSSA